MPLVFPDPEPFTRNRGGPFWRSQVDPGPGPAEIVAGRDEAELVRRWLDWLPRREAHILRRRFGLDGRPPATLDCVAAEIERTRERVRAIEIRGLRRLRRVIPLHYAVDREGIIERCRGRS